MAASESSENAPPPRSLSSREAEKTSKDKFSNEHIDFHDLMAQVLRIVDQTLVKFYSLQPRSEDRYYSKIKASTSAKDRTPKTIINGTHVKLIFHANTFKWLATRVTDLARSELDAVANEHPRVLNDEERICVKNALVAFCEP